MRGSIILEDMHLRDERAFAWLAKRQADGFSQFEIHKLAEYLRCHRNTATAIVGRLTGAGMIQLVARRYGGYVFRIIGPQ